MKKKSNNPTKLTIANLEITRLQNTLEHLTNKLVQVADENYKLKFQLDMLTTSVSPCIPTPQSKEISSLNDEIKNYQARISRLLEDATSYISRLLEDATSYDCLANTLKKEPCGKCLKCQLEQSKNTFAQNLYAINVRNDTRVRSLYEDALNTIAHSFQFWKYKRIAKTALNNVNGYVNAVLKKK